jgi:MFS transporter, MHS family, proline/betaine transporter
MRRAIAAAAIGNAMEWFDFGVYSYVTATIGRTFFPSYSPTAQLLLAFGTFAVAFLIRPFGGLFFGPLGDKIGRRRVLATTILLMAGSTFSIGLIPNYAQIGIWAPILLIIARLLQGFSTGGEYGGAATFMAEYAHDRNRGFLCSWLEFGTLGGYVLGAGLVTLLTFTLSGQDMHEWGWRIPFLLAAPLGITGLYLRTHLEDTPAFKDLQAAGRTEQSRLHEIAELAVDHRRDILSCIGIVILLNVADYTLLSYMPSYLNTTLGIDEKTGLLILIAVMLAMMVVITPIGMLSDRIGRKPLLIASCVGFFVLAWPAVHLMSRGNPWDIAGGVAILGLLLVILLGTLPATLPALFATRVRYGGFAIAYNISTSAFGGTAPLAIAWLIATTGDHAMPAYYLMAAAAVAFIPILQIAETARAPLRGALAR